MIGVFASTFLSFPVACLVAFGVFLLAMFTGTPETIVSPVPGDPTDSGG